MNATFTKMSKSTAEDWAIIVPEQMKFFKKLPDRILSHMELLTGDYGGFAVDRLQHSLQTAHRAAEAGEDDEYIVCALLHDIGDTLGSANHADVAAAILQPYVSEENHWMVKHHAIFQGHNFFHFWVLIAICVINFVKLITLSGLLGLSLNTTTPLLTRTCQNCLSPHLSRYLDGFLVSLKIAFIKF